MGCGASTPAVEDAGAERDGPLSPAAAAAGRLSASSQPGAPPIGMGRASVSEPNAARAAREEDLSLPTRSVSYDVLGQVQQMQRQLALVNPIPALGLLEAAELLSRRLQAPLVRWGGGGMAWRAWEGSTARKTHGPRRLGDAERHLVCPDHAIIVPTNTVPPPSPPSHPSIVGFTQPDDAKHSDGGGVGPMAANGGAPPPAVLLTAHGRGALVLERSVVMAGPDWSCTRLLERGRYAQESLLDGAVFYFSEDVSAAPAGMRGGRGKDADAGVAGWAGESGSGLGEARLHGIDGAATKPSVVQLWRPALRASEAAVGRAPQHTPPQHIPCPRLCLLTHHAIIYPLRLAAFRLERTCPRTGAASSRTRACPALRACCWALTMPRWGRSWWRATSATDWRTKSGEWRGQQSCTAGVTVQMHPCAACVPTPAASLPCRWQLWLSAVATGLLHVISGWQVAFTTRMLQRLDAVQDSVEFIAMLLQVGGGARLAGLRACSGAAWWCRALARPRGMPQREQPHGRGLMLQLRDRSMSVC